METPRPARDRWLLLALLLVALCIGMGLGAGLSARLASRRAAPVPEEDCGARRSLAEAASVGRAPIGFATVRSAEATSSESTTANDIASRARSAGPKRAANSKVISKPRGASAADPRADAGAPSARLGPDLHEALRLLRAAQRSLRAAEANRALSLLDQMARRAPDALIEEREVTRVLAHCAANDVDSARLTAAALRESDGASVYAHRLSKSCVGPAPAPATLLDEMRQRALN